MTKKLFIATAIIAALVLTAAKKTVFGQPAPQQQFVPITIDAAKFNALVADIQEISMPNKAFQNMMFLLNNLEKQAQAEAAAKVAEPPK